MIAVAVALALLIVGSAAAVALAFARAMRLPDRAPAVVRAEEARRPRVAFLGASLTHGKVSADWTALVGAALDVDVVNAGVNGDLAFNAWKRLPEVLALAPEAVVVLVGSNDVMASLDARRGARYRRTKALPQEPSREWYGENLAKIRDAVVAAGKRVVFCTLPPLGERLGDDVNDRVRAYNDVIREVAGGGVVVDVYEAFAREIERASRPRGFKGSDAMMLRAIVRRHLLGWSFTRISEAHGFTLLTDGIHANERGAGLIADGVIAALRAS